MAGQFKMKGFSGFGNSPLRKELEPGDTENTYTEGWRAGFNKNLSDEDIKAKKDAIEAKYPRKYKEKRKREDAIFEEKLRKSTNPKVRERYGIVKDTVEVKG